MTVAPAKTDTDTQEALGALASMEADGGRRIIAPLHAPGPHNRRRKAVFFLLAAGVALAPWVKINGAPAIQFDIPRRVFHLFGATFNAQDTWLLLFLALAFLAGLLFLTAWRGRLWCGYACPQSVFMEGLFRPLERLFDGDRPRALKLAQAPWTPGKFARRALKWAVFSVAATVVAFIFVMLFLSADGLFELWREGPASHPFAVASWSSFSALLLFNFGWFREQFCVVVCPYGRMQSLLHDRDSVVVSYDTARGEPRGRRGTHPLPVLPKAGACVDCKKCIYVCPTGIDIRNGLQMECLACEQCIDACDDVMRKTNQPTGLIRFMSSRELENQPRRFWRPRIALYGGLFIIGLVGLGIGLATRSPFEANLLRPPGMPWALDGDRVTNEVHLHVVNKLDRAARYRVETPSGNQGVERIEPNPATVAPHGSAVMRVWLTRARSAGPTSIRLQLSDDQGEHREWSVPILGPSP